MEVYLTSEMTYNEDNTFKQSYVINYPQMGYGCSIFVTCEGKWYATKDMICEEVDEKSIKMEFSEDFLDLAEMSESEAKEEFLKEMKSDDLKTEGKIISLGKDEITLSEDGKEYTMYRK